MISPVSTLRSSRRASGSERNSVTNASGSRPSAVQKSLNDSNTLVVSTPPKSTKQTLHECATSRAFSASIGTPSTNRPR